MTEIRTPLRSIRLNPHICLFISQSFRFCLLWISFFLGLAGCSTEQKIAEKDASKTRIISEDSEKDEISLMGPQISSQVDSQNMEAQTSDLFPIVIAVRSLPKALQPMVDLDPWGQRIVDDLLFRGLVSPQKTGAPWFAPDLADHCQQQSAAKSTVILCHLARGHQFHDGQPITPQDVVYSVELWLEPRHERLRQHYGLTDLQSIRRVDGPASNPDPKQWLEIRFQGTNPLYGERLAAIKIVPLPSQRKLEFPQAVIGSGPMKIAAQTSQQLVFEAASPREKRPKIVFQVISDGAQALTLLKRGEVHIIDSMVPSHFPAELLKPGVADRMQAFVRTPPSYDLLLFNTRQSTLKEPLMRRFLSSLLATPAATKTSTVPVDLYEPMQLDLQALQAAESPQEYLKTLPFWQQQNLSLEQGIHVLPQLGWQKKHGVWRRGEQALRLVLLWDGSSGKGQEFASRIRQAWQAIGAQVPSVTASWAYLRVHSLVKREFDVALVRLLLTQDEDLYPWFHSQGVVNLAGISDPTLDRFLEEYRQATTRSQRDALKQAIAVQLATLCPIYVLDAPFSVALISKQIRGLEFVDDLPRLDKLRLN